MAQQSYRANLSAAIYPMALSRAGRTVIVPGIDQNYDRRVDPTGEQKTPGIPQALYLENVLPTVEGYQSVGYKALANLPFTGQATILEIRSAELGTNHEILAFRQGSTQAWRWTGLAWAIITILPGGGTPVNFSTQEKFSYAVIAGFIFIFDGDNLWTYSPNSPSLFLADQVTAPTGTVTPAGTMDNLKAITASHGYLLFLKDDGVSVQVLWSSLLSTFDFAPSLVTGAGGGAVAEAQGRAVTVTNTSGGFYIFNTQNVLLAAYTGNSRYPFRISVVKGAEGLQTSEQLHNSISEFGPIYINSTRALVSVQGTEAQQRAPELTEFLERASKTDTFNYATNTFSLLSTTQASLDSASPYLYANRYLCVSFQAEEQMSGVQPFDTVYVFDLMLQRYGRLKISHTHVVSVFEGAREQSLGFVNSRTGTFRRVNFDASAVNGADYLPFQGVLLLGKFQLVRSRFICMEEMEVESSASGISADLQVRVLPSMNGKEFSAVVTPFETADSSAEVKKFLVHTQSQNVSVLIKGAFDLSSVILKFHPGGDA